MIFAEDIFNSVYIVFTHTILIDMVYQAAIVGLGNIGFRFSYDAKRKGTWSHVDAYNKCLSTELTGLSRSTGTPSICFIQNILTFLYTLR